MAIPAVIPPHHKLTPSSAKLKAYGGSDIINCGTCALFQRQRRQNREVTFHVTDTSGPAMLGLQDSQVLGLIKINCAITKTSKDSTDTQPITRNSLMEEYKDVFSGIGHFPGTPYHIQLRADAEPVVNPPRSVNIHQQEDFKNELKRMEEQGIISSVTQPTEWVNAFVIVEKGNGKGLRICLDPRDLNKSIKREHYYVRTIDDILPKVANAKFFSVLDARSGYWMVELDEESSLMTTFATPFGRYKFNRLPFGIVVSQDIFQRKMDEAFHDLPGVTGIADDTIVYGTTEAEHDANLLLLM